MTVVEHVSESPTGRHPLRCGASPATIRSWLLPGDADRFVAAYEAALGEARRTFDLTAVHDTVEHWRRPAELATGEQPSADEPLGVTRAKAGI